MPSKATSMTRDVSESNFSRLKYGVIGIAGPLAGPLRFNYVVE
jgi:hypothetical protein